MANASLFCLVPCQLISYWLKQITWMANPKSRDRALLFAYHEAKTSHWAKLNITGQGMLQNDQSIAIC